MHAKYRKSNRSLQQCGLSGTKFHLPKLPSTKNRYQIGETTSTTWAELEIYPQSEQSVANPPDFKTHPFFHCDGATERRHASFMQFFILASLLTSLPIRKKYNKFPLIKPTHIKPIKSQTIHQLNLHQSNFNPEHIKEIIQNRFH